MSAAGTRLWSRRALDAQVAARALVARRVARGRSVLAPRAQLASHLLGLRTKRAGQACSWHCRRQGTRVTSRTIVAFAFSFEAGDIAPCAYCAWTGSRACFCTKMPHWTQARLRCVGRAKVARRTQPAALRSRLSGHIKCAADNSGRTRVWKVARCGAL